MAVRRCAFLQRAVAAVLGLLFFAAPGRAQDHGLDGVMVDPLGVPDTQLEPVTWGDLDGWNKDDQGAAFSAFMTSCRPFLARKRAPTDGRPIFNALWHVCRRAAAAGNLGIDKAKARKFFEDNFEPVRIAKLGETTGLLTGYYEPVVDGSRFPNPEFHTPIYRRPPDLVMQGRAKAIAKATVRSKIKPSAPFPNRGTVGRLNNKKKLEPYYDRGAIEAGALDGQKLEICWIREPFDLMNIQIQGSARVRLEDGAILRIGYDSHNGFSYSAVGRVLIDRNLVPRDEMTMDRIRQWMHDNPDRAQEVRQTNKSFVFFRITGLGDENEPTGGQGVPLAPGRSIAVDKIHTYGTPFFIEADLPIESARPTTKFRRLMIAQDTGSAITGPARADLYWGAGDAAAKIAGRIRQQGRFVMLIPREVDMIEAGKKIPLPVAKPVIPEPQDAKKDGKTSDAKASDKTKTEKGKDAKTNETSSKDAKGADGKTGSAPSTDAKAKDDKTNDEKAKDDKAKTEADTNDTAPLPPVKPKQSEPVAPPKSKARARRSS